ncbi:MAG: discoidin domain-containing protein, partial [Proteobacteria bacterium]|nr:discoidin domain-containing protein [Pseudomonadota bacterium]
FRHLLFGSLPVIFSLLGGYIPLGVAGLALSAVIVAVKLFLIEDSVKTLGEKVNSFVLAMMPYILASIVIGPYLFSVLQFNKETISYGRPSLFYSAHHMAEIPQTLLRFFSTHFPVPGPFYEFSIVCGFPAIIVIALFLFSPSTIHKVSTNEWKLLKTSLVIYFIAVLAIFGEYSVVSDLIYYLVPSVGGMHIYQRFFLPVHLFFAVIVAIMLKAVVLDRPMIALKIVIAIFMVATTVCAYIVAFTPELALQIGVNNYLVFELFLGFLFSCTLMAPGKTFVYGVAIVLFCLPSMDLMNDRSHGENTFVKQREIKKIALDENERARLVSWIKQFSDKAAIKYVDITPKYKSRITGAETFPKDFPRIVLGDLNLSSYSGHNYYLSALGDYIQRMPVVGENIVLSPDWDLLYETGVDFIIAPLSGGMLQSLLPPNSLQNLYRLPNDVAIVPVPPRPFNGLEPLFDNGFFRVFPAFSVSQSLKNKRINIATGKPAKQSSTVGIYDARLAVDGNINGDFANGSVTHTDQDVNAWFEIDLGVTEKIDEVTIWNRTDGAGERLSNFWVFISDKPFQPTETASMLEQRPDTWNHFLQRSKPKRTISTAGARGRYIRIQFGGTQPVSNSFLSLAEVEVFRSNDAPEETLASIPVEKTMLQIHRFNTNYANSILFDLDVKQSATVQYLFWYNPRLYFFLNKKPITVSRADGLTFIDIPAGRNIIEIKYIHRPLKLFWFLYSIYGLVFLWAFLPTAFRGYAFNWFRSWR